MQVLTRTVLEPIPQRLPQRQGRALLSTQPRRRGQILPDPCSPPAVDRCQSPTVAAALDRLAGQPSVRQRPPGSPRTRRCPDRSLRPSVGGSTRVVRRIPPQSACQLYMELSTTPHLPSGAIRTCGSSGRPGDSAPNTTLPAATRCRSRGRWRGLRIPTMYAATRFVGKHQRDRPSPRPGADYLMPTPVGDERSAEEGGAAAARLRHSAGQGPPRGCRKDGAYGIIQSMSVWRGAQRPGAGPGKNGLLHKSRQLNRPAIFCVISMPSVVGLTLAGCERFTGWRLRP